MNLSFSIVSLFIFIPLFLIILLTSLLEFDKLAANTRSIIFIPLITFSFLKVIDGKSSPIDLFSKVFLAVCAAFCAAALPCNIVVASFANIIFNLLIFLFFSSSIFSIVKSVNI